MPQAPYKDVSIYGLPINGKHYRFYTLVSEDGVVAWMPDNEQQNVNPQFRCRDSTFVKVNDMNKWDIGRMLRQILLFQTKKSVPLEDIVYDNNSLIEKILTDLKSYPV